MIFLTLEIIIALYLNYEISICFNIWSNM